MVSQRISRSGNSGFTVIAAAIGTLIIAGVLISLNRPFLHEYFAVRSASNSFVAQLKEAQRITIGEDRDRRIRITSERGYVREKRAGAGWLFEEAYTLPEGLEIFGPHDIEFQSHSALSPVALYTISGPNNVRREIITQKNGNISRE
jgi:hypothetical protein